MPVGLFGWWPSYAAACQELPRPGKGKRRGVTQSPKRKPRRNRRKP